MKRIILILAVLKFTVFGYSQQANSGSNSSGLVYSLPKTELVLLLKIEKTSSKPGIFYQYSERYLATNKIITDESVRYRIVSAEISTQALPDSKRTFQLTPDKKSNLNLLSVNNKGLLCGINVSPISTKNSFSNTDFHAPKEAVNQPLLPLGEEYMLAGSVAKLAEGAAKQIYRIRESRLSLLTGDLEHLPSDGKSTQLMLDGLNKAEKELTELFIGSTVTSTETKIITISPEKPMSDEIVFRFSAHKGLVEKDDLSGNPYFISINPEQQISQSVSQGKHTEQNVLYTVNPVATKVLLSDGSKPLCTYQTLMPQFGSLIQVPAAVLEQLNVKISVDPSTGRLLSITK
ncbi:MAG: DUF4831 family protein [Paludibacter sp.]